MGKNILITGASNGIGYWTAYEMSKDKSASILVVARNAEKLNGLKKKCSDEGRHNVEVISGDITSGDFINVIYNYYKLASLEIDILINNAGKLINKSFNEVTREDINQQYEVNVFSPILLIQKMMPLLKRGGGHVVNIGSMGGFQGSSKFNGLSIYSSTKSALANLTECLAEEYKELGISFNCLALGAVQTEMLEMAFPGYDAPTQPQDMGKYISDFAYNGGKLISGKIIPVAKGNP